MILQRGGSIATLGTIGSSPTGTRGWEDVYDEYRGLVQAKRRTTSGNRRKVGAPWIIEVAVVVLSILGSPIPHHTHLTLWNIVPCWTAAGLDGSSSLTAIRTIR